MEEEGERNGPTVRTVELSLEIPQGLLTRIDYDIKQNKDYLDREDWIVTALRHFEAYRLGIER